MFIDLLILSVSESDFSQSVSAHESALVHVSVHAVELSLTRILPHLEIPAVSEHRFSLGVLGNHQLVAVQFAQQVTVVEIGSGVDERFLPIGFLHEMQELEEGVAEFFRFHSALGFHINHREQILVAWSALRHEVLQLGLLGDSGTIEVVGPYLHSIPMRQVDILLVSAVYIGSSFSCLQIDVSHLAVVTDGFPEHFSLIMTHVNAMNMATGIFALHLGVTAKCEYCRYNCYKNSFHTCKGTKIMRYS